jgi:hypothetical protein
MLCSALDQCKTRLRLDHRVPLLSRRGAGGAEWRCVDFDLWRMRVRARGTRGERVNGSRSSLGSEELMLLARFLLLQDAALRNPSQ